MPIIRYLSESTKDQGGDKDESVEDGTKVDPKFESGPTGTGGVIHNDAVRIQAVAKLNKPDGLKTPKDKKEEDGDEAADEPRLGHETNMPRFGKADRPRTHSDGPNPTLVDRDGHGPSSNGGPAQPHFSVLTPYRASTDEPTPQENVLDMTMEELERLVAARITEALSAAIGGHQESMMSAGGANGGMAHEPNPARIGNKDHLKAAHDHTATCLGYKCGSTGRAHLGEAATEFSEQNYKDAAKAHDYLATALHMSCRPSTMSRTVPKKVLPDTTDSASHHIPADHNSLQSHQQPIRQAKDNFNGANGPRQGKVGSHLSVHESESLTTAELRRLLVVMRKSTTPNSAIANLVNTARALVQNQK